MSDRGVFAVDRGIFTNAGFANEPFTEREAFLWLVAEAAWKERRVRSGATTVTLGRGQICHSVRFMADAWQWSKSRVDRFLVRLESRGSIARENGTLQTVLTLCNFEEFQRSGGVERDTGGTDVGQIAGQMCGEIGTDEADTSHSNTKEKMDEIHPQRDTTGTDAGQPKSRNRDKLEYTNNNKTHICSTAADKRVFQETFWPKYPKRKGSNPPDPAEIAYLKALKNGATHSDISAGLDGYITECRANEILGTKFVAMASTWLNQGRWKEHVGPAAKAVMAAVAAANSGHAYLERLSDDRWRDYVRHWRTTLGQWDLSTRTPPPDHPQTKVPPHILAEFRIGPRRAQASPEALAGAA
ncbi:hypothetical protein G3T14_15725 [Methylobacterium sp. BTF04]|uniref:hypothetical protein n=1 Tax=Methylobacterium sp. BTF04 TaxID=2708300 RepID=UPI0013D23CE1|nr:hypothetical protein [Methylobacterium sp. BTF04]NEU13569.1 hypothetical protein [Methylobacterium sp. BTF04]